MRGRAVTSRVTASIWNYSRPRPNGLESNPNSDLTWVEIAAGGSGGGGTHRRVARLRPLLHM